ncbi:MAG: biosynthetic-type acetolactate synthase large subunit [Mariprofundaceae bacterium]|nr:biosynthetic-type acetolactate synthase large subunit [Mariprofundaceae bacterium]
MKLTGAQIFVECLKREGVKHIFGYPGGAVLPIYDAIFYENEFEHILVRHEQAALHAANGYARASGRCGVALVTSGPGATNAVTGLADSNIDSIPTVCFTGQVPSHLIGSDAFQEADIVGVTRSVTKHNFLIKNVEDMAKVIRQAFYIATSGRPGAVLVDIPKDISLQSCEFEYPEEVHIRSYQPASLADVDDVLEAATLMAQARRPMIYSGGGIMNARGSAALLTKLCQTYRFPVTNTLMGLGGVPFDDEHFVGMLGMHGTYEANMSVSHCDVLIAVGARFDDRVTGKLSAFAPDAKIIHIDVDPASISKIVKADVALIGDVKLVLEQLLTALAAQDFSHQQEALNMWWHQIDHWRAKKSLSFVQEPDAEVKPQYVIEQLHQQTKGNAIVTTEVGQHQMWAAQLYGVRKPHRFITSGGLGTMGFGLPAALGVKKACPDATVIDIAGEASIQMNIQELSTAMQHNLPIKIAILNNSFMGMVRQWQQMFHGSRYSHSYSDSLPDFVKLAEAYGGVGLRATTPQEVREVIAQALAINDRFVLIDFVVSKEENVYPMVPTGAGLHEMVLA